MSYWIGVISAVSSGAVNNFGTVLQKKVINEIPPENRDQKFFRTLFRKRVWLLGLILQYAFGSILFMTAQVYIGPTLVPGLMASGLIVLAIGSIKLVGESLKSSEIAGIILMMLGTVLFTFSELVVSIPEYDFLEVGFLGRLTFFTGALLAIILILHIVRKIHVQFRAVTLSLISGILLSMSNYWISPLLATIVHVFDGSFVMIELVLFIAACIILILTNMFAVGTIQDAFKTGQASLLIPIQQLPILIVPGLLYLMMFLLIPPTAVSILWFVSGALLTICSTFLLGRRQVLLEKIE